MELRYIRSLVALADERHFTRAAARVPIAQSALSHHIRQLEDELGLPLVDRTTRRVTLTSAGEQLVAAARRALNELDGAVEELQATRELRRGRLTIGVNPAIGAFDLAGTLAAFHQEHPGVELIVQEGLSAALAAALKRDELDLALVTALRPEERAGLELWPLTRERLVALLPATHRLAARRRLRLAELRDERFIMLPRTATIRRLVDRAAAAQDFAPAVAFEVSEAARIREFVRAGLGVAVLPEGEARPGDPRLTAVGLREADLVHELSLARRHGRRDGPAVRRLLAMLGVASPASRSGSGRGPRRGHAYT